MSYFSKLAWILGMASMVYGQGSQLPKYTVATLPSASSFPTYTVQVIDGATATDCTVGHGAYNVLCTAHSGSWVTISGGAGGSFLPLAGGTMDQGADIVELQSCPVGTPNGTYCGATNALETTNAINACKIGGVDCTGLTDSSTGMNAFTTVLDNLTNKTLYTPVGAKLRFDSQWVITGQYSPYIYLPGTEVFGCNGSAGAVIKFLGVNAPTLEGSGGRGTQIEASGGSNCPGSVSNFTGSITTSNGPSSSPYSMSDGRFKKLFLTPYKGGAVVPNYIGFQIPNDGTNQELMALEDVEIDCGSNTNSTGFESNTQFADSSHWDRGGVSYCYRGIVMGNGHLFARNLNMTGNGDTHDFPGTTTGGAVFESGGCVDEMTNMVMGDGSGAILINSGTANCTGRLWSRNHFLFDFIPTGVYPIDIVGAGYGACQIFEDNFFADSGTVVPLPNNTIIGGKLTDLNNVNGAPYACLKLVGNSVNGGSHANTYFLSSAEWGAPPQLGFSDDGLNALGRRISQFAQDEALIPQGAQFNAPRSPYKDYQAWFGSTPVADNQREHLYTYSQPNGEWDLEHQGPASTPSVTIQPIFNGAIQLQSTTPPTVTISVLGVTGSTTWTYKVSCITGAGIESTAGTNTITNGNATLTSSNFNRVVFVNNNGCVQYKVYRTAAGGTPSTTGLIATVSNTISQYVEGLGYPAVDDTGLVATGGAPPTQNLADGVVIPNRIQPTAIPFSSAQTCNSATKGSLQEFTDSSTATWGATITGGGSNEVLGHCNGTNWTVAAI